MLDLVKPSTAMKFCSFTDALQCYAAAYSFVAMSLYIIVWYLFDVYA